ncbi:MAG: hypothetical protein N839_0002205 [Desulfofustis sp. PB-SRB1]|jgi:glutathione S-transferase|nr:hypothetical protein [Desulfofustis sp. PB-SRB1]MBM1001204.1 hypothetical protein [Desulfofustis sp. PB-SRB1]
MFAPVVLRFTTYGVELSGVAAAYAKTMLAHPQLKKWLVAAQEEQEIIEEEEVGQTSTP